MLELCDLHIESCIIGPYLTNVQRSFHINYRSMFKGWKINLRIKIGINVHDYMAKLYMFLGTTPKTQVTKESKKLKWNVSMLTLKLIG